MATPGSSYQRTGKTHTCTCSCMTFWEQQKKKCPGYHFILNARIDLLSSILYFSWNYFRQLQVLVVFDTVWFCFQLILFWSHFGYEGLELKIQFSLKLTYPIKKKRFLYIFLRNKSILLALSIFGGLDILKQEWKNANPNLMYTQRGKKRKRKTIHFNQKADMTAWSITGQHVVIRE